MRLNRCDRTGPPSFANQADFAGCAKSSQFRHLTPDSFPSAFDPCPPERMIHDVSAEEQPQLNGGV
jgi:hypothetical protein